MLRSLPWSVHGTSMGSALGVVVVSQVSSSVHSTPIWCIGMTYKNYARDGLLIIQDNYLNDGLKVSLNLSIYTYNIYMTFVSKGYLWSTQYNVVFIGEWQIVYQVWLDCAFELRSHVIEKVLSVWSSGCHSYVDILYVTWVQPLAL